VVVPNEVQSQIGCVRRPMCSKMVDKERKKVDEERKTVEKERKTV